ncbi:MAG: hypothetical protein WCF65_02175 [Parachlamydiaceae bacterium]
MESKIAEMQETIKALTQANVELSAWKQKYNSQKQSFTRMSSRLRKLCKKLTPSSEIVVEMQQLALEIRDLVKPLTQ